METEQLIRKQLVSLIRQGNAFNPLANVLEDIPYKLTGKKIEGSDHTIWEITEHIRICLYDLVEYSKDSYFKSPPWPDGYWPEKTFPGSEKEWLESIERIKELTEEMIQMVQDPKRDLYEPFAANPSHHLLRQATIVAEHNAFHTGQLAMLKKVLLNG
jgi:hypothetical protein